MTNQQLIDQLQADLDRYGERTVDVTYLDANHEQQVVDVEYVHSQSTLVIVLEEV